MTWSRDHRLAPKKRKARKGSKRVRGHLAVDGDEALVQTHVELYMAVRWDSRAASTTKRRHSTQKSRRTQSSFDVWVVVPGRGVSIECHSLLFYDDFCRTHTRFLIGILCLGDVVCVLGVIIPLSYA